MSLYDNYSKTNRHAAAISLDAIDISGSHDDDETISLAHNGEIHKIRLNKDGSRKGLGEYIAPKQQWGPFMLRRSQEVSHTHPVNSEHALDVPFQSVYCSLVQAFDLECSVVSRQP